MARPLTTWISKERVMRQLCVGRVGLAALVANGQLGVLRLPGLPEKYNAADADALVKQGTVKSRRAERELVEA